MAVQESLAAQKSVTFQEPIIKGNGKHLIVKYKRQHISALAFSPGAKFLAFGLMGSPYPDAKSSPDANDQNPAIIDLRDYKTGKLIHRLHAPFGELETLAFSPDGKWIAAGVATGGWRVRSDADIPWPKVLGGVYLWNVNNGKLHCTLTLKTGQVQSIAFSPDSDNIAIGSGDTTLRLWNLATGKSQWVVPGQGGYVSSIVFADDGKTIITVNWDNKIRFWDATNGKLKHTLKGHADTRFIGMAISPDRSLLLTSGNRVTLLWNLKERAVIYKIERQGQQRLRFSPNAKYIAGLDDIRGGDATINIYNTVPKSHSTVLQLEGSAFTFTPDSKFLVMASTNDDDYYATEITTIKYYKIGNSK